MAATEGYDLARSFAYSDSITDLPMLEAVGHPSAVNPDKALRKAAAERGWPVLDFHQPVALRSRVSDLRPSGPAMAGAAVGAGAAAAGLVWLATETPYAALRLARHVVKSRPVECDGRQRVSAAPTWTVSARRRPLD